MALRTEKQAGRSRLWKLCALSLGAAVMVVSLVAESVLALSAPFQVGSDIPYYYVSDGISDNGRFPNTWVGFYWNSDTGNRTISYNPRKCNDGGYDDTSDGDPRVTIYGMNSDGTVNLSNVIQPTTHIDACHNNDSNTPFTFNLSSTNRDTNINMKGVVVRVDSVGDGSSRAWFSLTTPDTDGASFGAMGGSQSGEEMTIGYSRDFSPGAGGGYYDLQTGFGSCGSSRRDNQRVSFFDTDNSKYQSAGSGDDNALRIQFQNLSTGTNISNTSSIIHDLSRVSRRGGTTTWFNVTANSSQAAGLEFDMAANTGYRLNINHLREGNDITVLVPTNEIYGKRPCPPAPAVWVMSGYTAMTSPGVGTLPNNAPVAPGQQVTFWHHVANDGGASTTQDIFSDTNVSGGLGTARGSQNVGQFTAGQDKDVSNDTITIPLNAPSGQQYCQRVGYQASAYNNSARSTGAWACVVVQYGYVLTPVVSVSPAAVVRSGEDFTFSYEVKNNSAYSANQVNWNIRQTITTPAGLVTDLAIASGVKPATAGDWVPRPPDLVSNIYPVGTTICRYLEVDSSTQMPDVPSEQGVCVLVASAPYVAVVGGNLWAGGSITSPFSGVATIQAVNTTRFGSFGEYGVFATGSVNYFGSAGIIPGGSSGSGTMVGNPLTFANTNGLGNFSTTHKITDFSCSPSTGSRTLAGRTYTANTPGNKEVICAPGGTVTITGDQVYTTAGATSFRDLPSLVVIADRIIVKGSVKRLDGFYYALSSFVSCEEGPRTPGSSDAITARPGAACNNQLVINGAVSIARPTSDGLILNRSFGGNTDGEPAEMIRMRPEVYLTQFEQARSSSILKTVLETELPARY